MIKSPSVIKGFSYPSWAIATAPRNARLAVTEIAYNRRYTREARAKWLFGQWLEQESARYQLPVIDPRLWDSLTELHVSSTQIRDLSPLASLTSLTLLELGGNEMSDRSPRRP